MSEADEVLLLAYSTERLYDNNIDRFVFACCCITVTDRKVKHADGDCAERRRKFEHHASTNLQNEYNEQSPFAKILIVQVQAIKCD